MPTMKNNKGCALEQIDVLDSKHDNPAALPRLPLCEAYLEGYNAHFDGKDRLGGNPYSQSNNSERYNAWEQGWICRDRGWVGESKNGASDYPPAPKGNHHGFVVIIHDLHIGSDTARIWKALAETAYNTDAINIFQPPASSDYKSLLCAAITANEEMGKKHKDYEIDYFTEIDFDQTGVLSFGKGMTRVRIEPRGDVKVRSVITSYVLDRLARLPSTDDALSVTLLDGEDNIVHGVTNIASAREFLRKYL